MGGLRITECTAETAFSEIALDQEEADGPKRPWAFTMEGASSETRHKTSGEALEPCLRTFWGWPTRQAQAPVPSQAIHDE